MIRKKLDLRDDDNACVTARAVLAALTFSTLIAACSAPESGAVNATDTIVPDDPRYDVFQRSNSAGDGSFASARGTVYLSFKANDARYCRAARFHGDQTAILACRDKQGWQIEAVSETGTSNNGVTQAVNDAVFRLNPKGELLNEREIVEASRRDWQ